MKDGEASILDGGGGGKMYGKLGHGDESDQDTPKRIEALIGVKAKQIACRKNHTAV